MSAADLTPEEREAFDAVLERVLDALPDSLIELLETIPLIVEDCPDDELATDLGLDHPADLCGLHDGVPLTERALEDTGEMPDSIHLYRMGILEESADEDGRVDEAELERQIRITVLHEIGHHFGLSESDLEERGYG